MMFQELESNNQLIGDDLMIEKLEERNESTLEVRNHMEDVVNHILDEMLSRSNTCGCDTCKKDIIAYALNHLPPKYAVTNKGELFFRLSEFTQQFEIDVQVVLVEAIITISKNPRHTVK